MQTFLPYQSFQESAKVLDYRRLGKQRIEAKQILQILLNETTSKAWRNHPAVIMWRGYEYALAEYGRQICLEWIGRGFKDNQLSYFTERTFSAKYPSVQAGYLHPQFSEEFHRAHRSNLIRKDSVFYGALWPNETTTLAYIWPTAITTKEKSNE